MSEKITINVGVFSIESSSSDRNRPIGLALCGNNGSPEINVPLAPYGYHYLLYKAYMSTLPKTQQSKMPQSYYEHDAVDAFGFLLYKDGTDSMPVVFCTDRGRKQTLAAKALYTALKLRAYDTQPNNEMCPVQMSPELLDTAIVQN